LASIDGKYDQVSRYNAAAGEFEHYVGNSKYDDFDTFEYGKGYEIYIKGAEDVSLNISGTVPEAPQDVSLKRECNLIYSPRIIEAGVEKSLSPLKLGIDYYEVIHYNKDSQLFEKYNAADREFNKLMPGEAYYIYCLNDTTWTVDDDDDLVTTTTFLYDGDGGRVKKTTDSGSTTYIGSLFEDTSTGKTTNHIYLGGNRICAVDSTGSEYYYHSDHLGSSNVITNDVGEEVQTLEYRPYGQVNVNEGEDVANHKFTGKELDASTGLYYYGARYYDAEIGRFISADPIVQKFANPQTLNRYSYCNNNPINYVDPTGHGWFKKFLGKIVGAVAAVVTLIATGGNVGAAFAAFNITDTAISGAQALYYGASPSRVLGSIALSIGLNIFVPGGGFNSSNLLLQIGVHAARGAAISAGTAAAVSGDVEGAAAWGAGAGGLGGFFSSQQFQNTLEGYGFRSNEGVAVSLLKDGDFEQALKFVASRYGDEIASRIASGDIKYEDCISSFTESGVKATGSLVVNEANIHIKSEDFVFKSGLESQQTNQFFGGLSRGVKKLGKVLYLVWCLLTGNYDQDQDPKDPMVYKRGRKPPYSTTTRGK